MASRRYIVRQGDYLTRLAHRMGFDANEVWNDSRNADVRASRSSREVLAPGGVLWVPDTRSGGAPIAAGGTHRYSVRVPTVSVRFIVSDGDRPVADEPYVVEGLRSRV